MKSSCDVRLKNLLKKTEAVLDWLYENKAYDPDEPVISQLEKQIRFCRKQVKTNEKNKDK